MSNPNVVQPGNQTPNTPRLNDLLDAHKIEIFKAISVARPGKILAFYPTTATADIEILQQQVTSIQPNGIETLGPMPELRGVPIYTLGGGGVTVTFPISEGDECVVLFTDRQLDNWLLTGQSLAPSLPRFHDLSDGIALVGLRSLPRALGNISSSEAQLRTDDGATFVGINPITHGVRVHGGTVYEWDVHGYGQKITWNGGNNYTIDNYVTGAVITTNNHPIAPPGPP